MSYSIAAGISGVERTLLAYVSIGNIAACASIRPFYDAHHQQIRSATLSLAAEVAALGVVVFLSHARLLDLSGFGLALASKWVAIAVAEHWLFHQSIRRLSWRLAIRPPSLCSACTGT